MSRKGIGFGVLLIAIGVLAFLLQFGILSGSVFMVFFSHIELTISLILIVTGLNIIFRKYYYTKIFTWAAFFAVMIIYGNYVGSNVQKTSYDSNKPFVVEQFEETGDGELKINASALKFTLGSTEANLIDGMAENVDIEHKVEYKNGKKTAVVKFDTNSNVTFGNFFETFFTTGKIPIDRKCSLNVSDNITWNMNMKLDAIDSDLDLSGLKVKTLEIDGDAGNFKLTLGQKYESTKVNIDTDAAKVQVFVPVNSGVRVKVDGDASSTDFNDISLVKKGGYYISENYDKMDKRIELDVKIDAGYLAINGIKGSEND